MMRGIYADFDVTISPQSSQKYWAVRAKLRNWQRRAMSKIRKPSVKSKDNAEQFAGMREGFCRRSLLKSAVGAAVGATAAGFAGAISSRAQVQGLYTTNTAPEIPLPMGSLTYLDKKQYIHNMEIISHLPGAGISGGEPLMVMWAKGKQRLLPAGGDFIDVSEAKNPVALNKKRI